MSDNIVNEIGLPEGSLAARLVSKLAKSPGKPVRRDVLGRFIYQGAEYSDGALSQRIRNVRIAIKCNRKVSKKYVIKCEEFGSLTLRIKN